MSRSVPPESRAALKSELYKLLWELEEYGPLATPGTTDDPAESEEICDDDLKLLIDTYRAERDHQFTAIKRVFHALEGDLLALAARNQANRGVLGFHAADFLESANADLGFALYPKETALKYCRFLGWTCTQEFMSCTGCQGPYVENLWIPPMQSK